MAQLRTSQQLAKLEEKLNEGKDTKAHKYGVQYQRLDDEMKKVGNKAYKLVGQWTEEELLLMKALKVGDEFVVNKKEYEYTAADGTTKTGWNLASIAPKETFKPKEKKEWKGKGGGGYDAVGQQVGNCVTNAIASLGAGKTMEEYEERMFELAQAGDRLRAKIENKITQPVTKTETTPTESVEPPAEFDSIDDVPW